MGNQWYLRKNGDAKGPYTMEQLSSFVREGKLKKEDMVYDEKNYRWLRAEHVEGLFPGEPEMYGRDEEAVPDYYDARKKGSTLQFIAALLGALILFIIASYLFRTFF
ncbi:MAG: DUF4339 domain-containing protein [Candidatus Syntrophonatronum acetioxidans]|uniref:DUF4339 domain-containing protein n=1 Tax=Candidatus Syntrophonatronum acetioxidans TaxID=1795816 RepID=A0A424YBA4_9FIRM|nr:MAG: DUF4339 domain-containing protein [Candidatus Syntrophonatronum acetioxidans]